MFLRYFKEYFEFFAVIQNFYLLLPRFLAEPLTMFYGALFGKDWSWWYR